MGEDELNAWTDLVANMCNEIKRLEKRVKIAEGNSPNDEQLEAKVAAIISNMGFDLRIDKESFKWKVNRVPKSYDNLDRPRRKLNNRYEIREQFDGTYKVWDSKKDRFTNFNDKVLNFFRCRDIDELHSRLGEDIKITEYNCEL